MAKFTATHQNPVSENMPGKNNILRTELNNGARLLSFRNPSSPAVVIRGYLNCGAIAESTEKLGTASLTASMLMAGTEKQTFKALNASIESIGASLYFGAGALQTTFAGQCLPTRNPARSKPSRVSPGMIWLSSISAFTVQRAWPSPSSVAFSQGKPCRSAMTPSEPGHDPSKTRCQNCQPLNHPNKHSESTFRLRIKARPT